MLTNVNFSCGHTAEVNLSNNEQKRLEKIAELELKGLCPDCRKAEWEKEDKKNSVGCACVRTSVELYKEKFSYCKERLTGYPKEKDFTYIYVPYEDIIIETLRKYIAEKKVPFEEAASAIKNNFKEKYPEDFNTLHPVSLEDKPQKVSPVIKTEPQQKTNAKPKVETEVSASVTPSPLSDVFVKSAPSVAPVTVPESVKKSAGNLTEVFNAGKPENLKPVTIDDDPYAAFDDIFSPTKQQETNVSVASKTPVAEPDEKKATDSIDDMFEAELDNISKADLDADLPSMDADDLDAFFDEFDKANIETETVTPPVTIPEPVINNSKAVPTPKDSSNSASDDTDIFGGMDDDLDNLLNGII